MGFCLFNNTAVAARWAQREGGVERVAILDWDVHHGNGTESIFLDDPTVLTISLHQDGLYPADRGELEVRGTGAGEGANVNIPLPAGHRRRRLRARARRGRRAGAAGVPAGRAADRRGRPGRVGHRPARPHGDHRRRASGGWPTARSRSPASCAAAGWS